MKTRSGIGKKIERKARISRYVIYKETLVDFKEQFWSFLGAFIGILLIALLQSYYLPQLENVLLIGSFGASSVLIYGAVESPLAQPRNFIGGQIISAFIGVTIYKIIPDLIWIAAPLAVATSIVVMQMTKTLHPPGGATALIAVIGTEKIKSLGYFYVVSPVLMGTIILFITALIFNNISKHRKYPENSRMTSNVKRKFQRITRS
ncbi:HPP family protein [Maribacter hydrothermalis]|uniref:HPP family protein n=1 Tax=Maribacter hydrothermalis TaxID=1836467 RepID=A0A1B7ZEZ1_9FLAO|nr:HPP family protein [Maribacter hydrothermalis]APQ17645.1 HPP family protein [Maribacter hydrothermalis]OBR42120.1 HPP family protein [Maribacter hydrothermalis]